jgi:DNA-binding SARP family transcriptional activator
MEPLQIITFGGLRIDLGETPIDKVEARKAEALMVYLACNRRSYSREVLANLLWDERSQKQSLTNLRVVLTKLRKSLKPYLLIDRETIAFNPEAPVCLDVVEFEARLNSFHNNSGAVDPLSEDEAQEIEHALDLYHGEFLEGFYLRKSRGFEAWLVQERERLHRLAISALHDLVRYDLESNAYLSGVAHASRLIAMDPFNELAYQQMIRLLAYSGRRSEALAQFEACRQMLWEEFEVEPAPETMMLVDQIRAGKVGFAVTYEALSAGEPDIEVPNPYKGLHAFREADADDFFGREALIDRLITRLSEDVEGARFMALVGPSGCGKSSLAKAGLIPALRRGALPNSEKWIIMEMIPGSHPFEEVAATESWKPISPRIIGLNKAIPAAVIARVFRPCWRRPT